jgi:hypothetical protein
MARPLKQRGGHRTPEIDNTILAIYNMSEPDDRAFRSISETAEAEYGIKISHETVRKIIKENGMEAKKRKTRKKRVKPEVNAEMSDREKLIIEKFDGPLPEAFRSLGRWNIRLLITELRFDGHVFHPMEIENTLKKFGRV